MLIQPTPGSARLQISIGVTATALMILALLAVILILAPATANAADPSLNASPAEGTVGADVTLTGAGLAPGTAVDLIWGTWKGTITATGNMYEGRQIEPHQVSLGQIKAGDDGKFSFQFKVPADYGGTHTIVAQSGGEKLAQTGFRTWPRLNMSTDKGPAGTPIKVTGDGFGLGYVDSQFHVIYDNHYMGLFSGVATGGKVELTIPAAGQPGLHRIDIYPNYYGPAYLNNHDGFPEYANVPRWNWDFTVTPGAALPHPAAESGRYVSDTVPGDQPQLPAGPELSVTPSQGPVDELITVSAGGFKPDEEVELVWQTITGAYIQTGGFRYEDRVLANAKAGTDGRVSFQVKVPPSPGGWAPLLARAASQTAVGKFGVVRAATINTRSGPAGTQIHIRLTGVGWRSWENNTAVTWDNAYTGYACALGPEKGSINLYLTAVGEPGRRVIGLYPAIFRGPATVNYGGTQPDNQRLSILTPADLPEYIEPFFFTFDIEGNTAENAVQQRADAGASPSGETKAEDTPAAVQAGIGWPNMLVGGVLVLVLVGFIGNRWRRAQTGDGK